MLRIPCPFCGERDHDEFEYGGDATIAYPALEAEAEAWAPAVYRRADPKGVHHEYWRHARGCRSWLVVTRDTVSHAILAARFAHPARNAAMGGSAVETAYGSLPGAASLDEGA